MAGKSGKRLPFHKKKQGRGPGELNESNVSYGSSSPVGGAVTEGHPQQHQQQHSSTAAAAPVPRRPSHPPRGGPQRTQSTQSEGSRGPSPMMISSPSAQGFIGMGAPPQYGGHGGARSMEHMMHMSTPYVPTGGDQHPHNQYQQHHHPQGGGHLPAGMATQSSAFQQPMHYYPQQHPVMNYSTTAPLPTLPSGISSSGNVRGYNMGTSGMSGGVGDTTGIGTLPGTSASSAAMAAAAEGMKLMVQRNIERGLQIDFYSEGDPMILASWASFFRDQFIETRHQLSKAKNDRTAEAYRRATGFVERVEMKILDTNAMKQIFRRLPITAVDDPMFVDTCYRAIIDFHMRNPPFDGFTFGNPTWRDYMWFKAGLMRVVDKGRNRFLDWYSQQIRDSLDLFVQSSSSGVEEELLEASTSGMQSQAAYARIKQVYVNLIEDVLPTLEESGTPHPVVIGTKVRSFFSLEEEAFILAVIRAHLQSKHDQQKATLPHDGPLSAQSKVVNTTMELCLQLTAQESNHGPDDPILIFQDATVHE